MNADQFAQQFMALAPTVEQLRELGFSQSDIESYRRDYWCPRVSNSGTADPLLDFCENFDLSRVEIGGLTFHRPAEFDTEHWTIGYDEDDPILFAKAGNLVSVRGHENPKRQIAVCAKSSDGFLSALLCAEKFLAELLFHPEKPTGGEERSAVLERCVALAEGEECRDFYRGVLGLNESGRVWRLLSRPISAHPVKRIVGFLRRKKETQDTQSR